MPILAPEHFFFHLHATWNNAIILFFNIWMLSSLPLFMFSAIVVCSGIEQTENKIDSRVCSHIHLHWSECLGVGISALVDHPSVHIGKIHFRPYTISLNIMLHHPNHSDIRAVLWCLVPCDSVFALLSTVNTIWILQINKKHLLFLFFHK